VGSARAVLKDTRSHGFASLTVLQHGAGRAHASASQYARTRRST